MAVGWSAVVVLGLVAGRAAVVVTRARRSVRDAGVEPWLGRHENRGDFDLVVLPTDRLLVHVWGNRAGGNRQLLKQLVHRLRQKIEDDPAEPRLVKTVPNAGYLIDPAAAPQ